MLLHLLAPVLEADPDSKGDDDVPVKEEPEADADTLADRKQAEGDSKVTGTEKEEACFGPYDSHQMAHWANEGYFSSGGGALVRQVCVLA